MSCVDEPSKSLKSFYQFAGWNVILYLDDCDRGFPSSLWQEIILFSSSGSGSGLNVLDLTYDHFF